MELTSRGPVESPSDVGHIGDDWQRERRSAHCSHGTQLIRLTSLDSVSLALNFSEEDGHATSEGKVSFGRYVGASAAGAHR